MARRLASDDAEEQIEILVVMRQGCFRPPTRGQGGQSRFAPRSGPPRTGPAARFGAPPPRDRKDITCINCNRKGHTVSECRQPKVKVKDRKCFICQKTGHIAKYCKEKPAPLKAILDAGPSSQGPAVMCVQLAPPRSAQLVNHLRPVEPRRSNGNLFPTYDPCKRCLLGERGIPVWETLLAPLLCRLPTFHRSPRILRLLLGRLLSRGRLIG